MSLQVFLQARLLGSESFLAAPASLPEGSLSEFVGRSVWLSLLCEVLPRALLAELKLSRMLLGSSSAGQFFLVLPEEAVPAANEFLRSANSDISSLSGGLLQIIWVTTEELGSWPVAYKRLNDAFEAQEYAPLAHEDQAAQFTPFVEVQGTNEASQYFSDFGNGFSGASKVGWSKGNPAHLLWNEGDHAWAIRSEASGAEQDEGEEPIVFPKRLAMNEAGHEIAQLDQLAERSEGVKSWAVLCGDVDQFASRLQRANTIEEFLQVSFLFKSFFLGELGLLCTLPEFWRKVTLLSCGGDDFVLAGSWDALILFARELQRVFEKFIQQNLASAVGVEGKTMTVALAIAPDEEASVATVYEQAQRSLREAKTSEPGTLHLFGKSLEWKRLADAEELKGSLVRMARDYGFGGEFIHDLAAVYRETFATRSTRRGKAARIEKPWRTYMQLSQVLPTGRSKELLNLRNNVLTQLLGKRIAGLKLRPSARVGLDWARWAAGK